MIQVNRGWLWRRCAHGLGVLLAAYTVSFLVLYGLPSDPAAIAADAANANGAADSVAMVALRAKWGLDQPLWRQYASGLIAIARGDLGASYVTGLPVRTVLAEALPSTALLASVSFPLAVVAGVGIALVSTVTRYRPLTRVLRTTPSVGTALPTFWVGLVLLQVFSFHLHVLPPFGDRGMGTLILPTITLALPTASVIAIVMIRALEDTWQSPFVDAVRAKGVSRWRTQWRHALRVSTGPLLSLTGVIVGNMLAGSVVVETVFSRGGIGRLTQQSVLAQDIPVVLALVMVSTVVFVTVTIAVDVLRPLIDPRIADTRARRREDSLV